MKILFLILFLSLNSIVVYGLNVDSLKNVANSSLNTSDKVGALIKLSSYFLRIDTIQSLNFATKAYDLAEKNNDIEGILLSSDRLARYYAEQGSYSKAKSLLINVIEKYDEQEYPAQFAAIYVSLANIHDILSEFELALDYYLKAEKLFGFLDDTRGSGLAQMGIANVFSTTNFYAEAISYYQKSFKNLIEHQPKSASWSLNNMALTMMEIDQHDSALYYFEKSLKMKLELGDLYGASYTYSDMGTLFEKLNQNEKALKSYELALEMKLSLEGINPETIGSAYNKIGKQNILIGQYTKAIENLEKGLDYSKKSGSLQYIAEAYKNISEAYSKSGDDSNAFKYLQYYSETKDSLTESKYSNSLSELKVQYETEQKDKDIELLNNSKILNEQTIKLQDLEFQESKRKNDLITVLLVGAIVVIVLAFGLGLVLYKSNINRKKANILLEQTNNEISFQRDVIEEKHREITDSINYAERIQRSFLASKELLDQNLTEYFVIFKPKDVVSGDFYWAGKLNNGSFGVCCADSTGHGVPGAIMSILNISSIEKAIETESSPSKILDKTREIIIDRLKKDGSPEGGKDGMDCSFISITPNQLELSFSGANNSIFIIRDNELMEFQRDRMPVGKHENDTVSFSEITHKLKKGDIIYALTDGMPDQFGGDRNKKFMMKKVKNLFKEVANKSMKEQKEIIEKVFESWKGDNEQLDDVCIMGIKI